MSKTAFLFPGQGSQSVGMMSGLADAFGQVGETFAEASAVLGYDLRAVVTEGPARKLDQTEVTQPAMLAADIATWRCWLSLGGAQPDFFAGHSLGEYAALVAAGALAFGEAVAIVAERGRLMQQATPPGTGAMAAVLGLEDEVLSRICNEVSNGETVACANFNAPGQVVISGDKKAVEQVGQLAKAAGAKRVLPLPVSVPSHCALMKPAAVRLQAVLRTTHFEEGSVPVIQNADACAYVEVEQIREALGRQLWQPVRWTDTIRRLLDAGVNHFSECGPGKVLAGLNRRISRDSRIDALTSVESLRAALGG
ncbi:MAG: ACP S-malonyltransferase [Lysobacterales bacterium]